MKFKWLIALLAVFSLIAAACGDDDNETTDDGGDDMADDSGDDSGDDMADDAPAANLDIAAVLAADADASCADATSSCQTSRQPAKEGFVPGVSSASRARSRRRCWPRADPP